MNIQHTLSQYPFLIPFAIAGFWFLIFLISFLYDRRLFRNSIFLVLTLMFAGLGGIFAIATVNRTLAEYVAYGIVFLIPVAIGVLAIFLTVNGVTMLRREGRRPANLLSLAAGIGIFGLVIFGVVSQLLESRPLTALVTAVGGVLTYVSFLFVCFLIYAFVYSRVRSSRKIHFVIVLGSGIRGTRVPPLLASRLDRGKLVYDRAIRKGRSPMIITAGGQGPGEDIPESHAMATYLIERGVGEDQILREDKSTTTTENLLFSRALMVARNPKYRCLIVTNNFHAFRAALTARKVKVNGQVVGSPTARYYWPTATIREFVAILFSHKWINGLICGFLFLIPFLQFI